MELLTTIETQNTSLYTITTTDPLTPAQVNIAPIRQIHTTILNSNVLAKTLSLGLGDSLTNGPTPYIYLTIPADGLVIPTSTSHSLFIIRGLAFINYINGFLFMFSTDLPTVSFRQTYPELFPVGTTAILNNGVLNNTLYITVISSPTKSGDTWTWPLYDTNINISADTSSYDIDIYPYKK